MRYQTRHCPIIGLVTLYAVLAGCSSEAPFDELLVRAENAVARNDVNAAVVDIKTALQQKPADPDARRLLGEIYLFQQQARAAADELERSLRSEFDTATARNFVKALYLAGEIGRAHV